MITFLSAELCSSVSVPTKDITVVASTGNGTKALLGSNTEWVATEAGPNGSFYLEFGVKSEGSVTFMNISYKVTTSSGAETSVYLVQGGNPQLLQVRLS